MEKPFLKVKKFKESAIIPSKRKEDAAYDLYGIFDEDFVLLKKSEIKMISTGIGIQIPADWVFYIGERGSTGSKGIARRCGIVDSGYRGEVFIPLNNTSNKDIIFSKHEGASLAVYCEENNIDEMNVTIYPQSKAIAQAMILYCPHIEVEEVTDLSDDSERGSGSLGSSNK
jgi:dUTP pyrophosphatase